MINRGGWLQKFCALNNGSGGYPLLVSALFYTPFYTFFLTLVKNRIIRSQIRKRFLVFYSAQAATAIISFFLHFYRPIHPLFTKLTFYIPTAIKVLFLILIFFMPFSALREKIMYKNNGESSNLLTYGRVSCLGLSWPVLTCLSLPFLAYPFIIITEISESQEVYP